MKWRIIFFIASVVAAAESSEKCKVIRERMSCMGASENDLPKTAHPDVHWLVIFKSNVANIKASMLKNLPKLTDFHAEAVGIEKVEDDAFKSLKSLNWIDLSTNKIKSVSPNLIEGLPIDHFNISRNSELALPVKKPFLKSDKLRWLYMDDCEIKTVYSETFQLLPLLRSLSLARNQLTTLPEDIFQNNRAINALDLTGNKIKVLSSQVFANLYTIVARLEMNPWVCDCNLTPLLLWSKHNVIKGEVKCAEPAGKKWKDIVNPTICATQPRK